MANKIWLGAAAPVTDVKFFVLSGTWASTETCYIEINGKRMTMTLTATMTLAQMAQALAAMLTGAAAVNGEVRDAVGSTIGEFAILSVTYNTTSYWVRLEGTSEGRPIGAVTVGDTAAAGTLASGGGTDRTGSGPRYWDNVDNWDGHAAVPAVGDTIIFDHRAVDGPAYNITLAYAPAAVWITNGFGYDIGLPAVNTTRESLAFDEPNVQYLSFTSCVDVRVDAPNAGMIKLDFGSAASTMVVENSGTTRELNAPPVLLKGNHASNSLTVNNGQVGYCYEGKTTGNIGTLVIGGAGSPNFESGDSVTLATVTVESGFSRFRSALTTLTQNGGEVEHVGANIGMTTLNLNAGTFYPKTVGTYAAVNHGAGVIDTTRDARSRTFTNYYMYGGGLLDPSGTIAFTNGIRIYPKLSAVQLDLPAVKRYTLSAV